MNAYFSSLKIFTATQVTRHSTVVTVEGEEEEEEDPCDVDDPDYEPYFHLTAILPDECITEMEEAAFKEIEFGLEKEEDNEEEVAGAEESEADHSIPGIVKALARLHMEQCSEPDCKRTPLLNEEFVGSAYCLRMIVRGLWYT
nr:hypothetical protein BaRGS_008796 [Batillaria attramentaria]